MHKSYYAVVTGVLKDKKGTFIDKLEKTIDKKVLLNTKNGKHAELNYEVIKEIDKLSLVKIDLITGRYHQIRLQFASRNYPLYGDNLCFLKSTYKTANTKRILAYVNVALAQQKL